MPNNMPQWYFETKFEVPVKPQGYPQRLMIITAFNPQNEQLSEAENLCRNAQLQTQLSREFSWCFEINGYAETLAHKELGYMVDCADLGRACDLGLEYQQDAIYYVIEGQLFVVQCAPDKRQLIAVGDFQQLLNI